YVEYILRYVGLPETPMDDVIGQIERVVGRIVRRDISGMAEFAKGNLARAARSLAQAPEPHVGIVAGFFIRHAEPPSPETDGLNGMGQLAAGLAEAGMRITVISDAPCAKAVWAVVDALPTTAKIEIVDINAASVRRLRTHLEREEHRVTHLVAIE